MRQNRGHKCGMREHPWMQMKMCVDANAKWSLGPRVTNSPAAVNPGVPRNTFCLHGRPLVKNFPAAVNPLSLVTSRPYAAAP